MNVYIVDRFYTKYQLNGEKIGFFKWYLDIQVENKKQVFTLNLYKN